MGSLYTEPQKDAQKPDSGITSYRLAARYLAVLCLLLAAGNLFQTIHMVQMNNNFQTWSLSQKEQVKELARKCNALNLTYSSLFTKFPELDKYCPITNKTSNERSCRRCPEGWDSFGEKCYFYSMERQDWKSSQCHCKSLGGHLVVIRSEEEQRYLWKKAKALSQGDSYWIGLHDSNSGAWQWVNNISVMDSVQFWGYMQEREESGELCARLAPSDNYKVDWYTFPCKNTLKKICERRSGSLL